jgi:ribonuclease HII
MICVLFVQSRPASRDRWSRLYNRRVLIYAGIDEAGYGPVLGPLCVACTTFVINNHDPDITGHCDLWKRLSKAVCRKRTDKRHRVAVDDSKLLKGANDGPQHPLKFLERAVLSFVNAIADCDASQAMPATCADLLSRLGVRCGSLDWYRSTTALPVGQTPDELSISAARVRKTLADQGVACDMLRCEAIDPSEFNDQVERMGNKANVNLCAALRHIDAVWHRWPAPHHHPRVIADRQGGRTRYLETLMQAYPDAQVQVLCEDDRLSRYRLDRGGSKLTVSFIVEAERQHLPVALASMTAKYVRELFMLRLNRHFRALMPELKPTAGYNEDGRRYLSDIEPLIAERQIERRQLVRCV